MRFEIVFIDLSLLLWQSSRFIRLICPMIDLFGDVFAHGEIESDRLFRPNGRCTSIEADDGGSDGKPTACFLPVQCLRWITHEVGDC